MMFDHAIPVDELHQRKFGVMYTAKLFYSLPNKRQNELYNEMQKALDGKRDPVTDKDLYPKMDRSNPEILY